MKDWFLQRAKAFGAAASAGIVSALLQAFEVSFGIELSLEVKATIISGGTAAASGLVVYFIPNKQV